MSYLSYYTSSISIHIQCSHNRNPFSIFWHLCNSDYDVAKLLIQVRILLVFHKTTLNLYAPPRTIVLTCLPHQHYKTKEGYFLLSHP